jgi:hypothetical protein
MMGELSLKRGRRRVPRRSGAQFNGDLIALRRELAAELSCAG